MHVLFIILNETDYLDEILSKFIEVGVKGATILDSQGMGSAIVNSEVRDVPLFGFLKSILEDANPYNKTIFTVIDNEVLLKKTVRVIQELMANETKTGAGFMFTVPIGQIYGLGNLDK